MRLIQFTKHGKFSLTNFTLPDITIYFQVHHMWLLTENTSLNTVGFIQQTFGLYCIHMNDIDIIKVVRSPKVG